MRRLLGDRQAPTLPQRAVALLVCGLIAFQHTAALEEVGRSQSVPCWLLGTFRNGPNNQKEDLRNLLALGKELQCGLVLTGFYKHYLDALHRYGLNSRPGPVAGDSRTDGRHEIRAGITPQSAEEELRGCFTSSIPNFMNFSDVLDRRPIDKWLPTITPEQLYAGGWNGSIDAVLLPKGFNASSFVVSRHVQRSLLAAQIHTANATVVVLRARNPINCNETALQELRKKIKGYRMIMVASELLLGQGIKLVLSKESLTLPEKGCQRSLHEAPRLLQPAPWIQEVAQQYISQYVTNGSFAVVHVRPFADQCLQAWEQGKIVPNVSLASCYEAHRLLHDKIGPCTKQLLARTGVDALFVMTHPALQTIVDKLLQQAGVRSAQYLDMSKVMSLTGCHDNSATAAVLVEEAIAARADHFLGCALSSITHTAVLERLGLNNTRNTFFEYQICS